MKPSKPKTASSAPPDRRFLTVSEVAELTGLSHAHVRRFANLGRIPSSTTSGGHRRFLLADVERFHAIQTSEQQRLRNRAPEWLEVIRAPDVHVLLGALHSARGRMGSWTDVAERLGDALRYLGRESWLPPLGIAEEHILSERLHRALTSISDHFQTRESAPTCLLATPPWEEHTLGLNLAELTAREMGWRTIWVGRNVPVADLAMLAERFDVIALSASVRSELKALDAFLRQLMPAVKGPRVRVVLGGSGEWPETFPGTQRIESFVAFRRFLIGGRDVRSRE